MLVYVGVGADVLEVVEVGVGDPIPVVVVIGDRVMVVVVVPGVSGDVVDAALGVTVRNSRNKEKKQRDKAMSGIQCELTRSCTFGSCHRPREISPPLEQ